MEQIKKTNWLNYDYDILKSDDGSHNACMEDCQCMLVIHNNDLQRFWKKSMPLLGGRADNSSIAFVKVHKAVAIPPMPIPTLFPSMLPKQRNEKGEALTIIGISLVAFSFVYVAFFLLILLYTCQPKLKALQEH
ncbi:hypothetical protein SUGI_0716180 [Cryptomeria japonica]|nr:hypothetical protein SUGI_0716180 [Cryptomeria japonica]